MIGSAIKFRGRSPEGCLSPAFPRYRDHPSRRFLRFCLVLLPLFVGGLATLADSRPSEYDVKAAYLLNFGKFVRTAQPSPAAFGNSFDICVIGDSPIEGALKSLTANENIGDRPVRVLRLKDGTQARACQIAYFSASEGPRLDQELEQLRGSDVLTVSDTSSFLAQGGMIEFLLISNHVRFSVSLNAVKRTRLVLSSEFLRVAYSVSGEPGKESAP
jgi:YfiR/HmsC-like